MSCLRLLRESSALLRRAAAEGCSGLQRSAYSTLPEDLAAAAARARYPARRSVPAGSGSTAAGVAAAAGGEAAAMSPAAAQQAAVKDVNVGSPWMLPWERRQLQGGALRWWEKVYWGVFVVGIALILFNRLEWEKAPDPAEEEKKRLREEKRMEAARLVLAGKSILVPWGTDDPFAGMSPEEIEEFCQQVTGGASRADPFEGLSPEEIDEYVQKHGTPAGAQL